MSGRSAARRVANNILATRVSRQALFGGIGGCFNRLNGLPPCALWADRIGEPREEVIVSLELVGRGDYERALQRAPKLEGEGGG